MPFTTVLYADQANSTTQLTRLGDERARPLRREMFQTLTGAVTDHGGRVVDNTGDGAVCAFPSAVAAAQSAVMLQLAIAELNEGRAGDERLGVRIGLHAGEPVEGEDGRLFGATVVVAARLCAIARPGQTLASETVRSLAEPAGQQAFHLVGRMALKGMAEPTTIVEVTAKGARRAKRPIALSPLGGLAFVLLIIVLNFVDTGPTSLQPTDAELSRFYIANREAALLFAGINGAAMIGYFAFVLSLSHALARSADAAPGVARASLWAGMVGGGVAVLGLALQTLPAFRLAESGDLGAVRTLWDFSVFVDAMSFVLMALFAGIASFGVLRWKLLPGWIGVLGLLLAPSAALAASLVLVDLDVNTAARSLVFLVFLIWVASASGALLQSPTMRA